MDIKNNINRTTAKLTKQDISKLKNGISSSPGDVMNSRRGVIKKVIKLIYKMALST